MGTSLQEIIESIQQSAKLDASEKVLLIKALKQVNKAHGLTQFKLDRMEKDRQTLSVMLEESIQDLEKKGKAIEEQNRELEIETSLERVRTSAMRMNAPADMLGVCKIICQQLELLNVKDIRNVQTAIFHENLGSYTNFEFYARHDKLLITETKYNDHPTAEIFADQMLKGANEIWIHGFEGEEVKKWLNYQKTTNVFIDARLETADSLTYYWYSLGPVALGISTYTPLDESEINLFKRFRNVFELAYRRYLDIEKAQMQAREAEIQLALERIRARTAAMQQSKELGDTVSDLFRQLLGLGIQQTQVRTCAIVTFNDDRPVGECWITGPDGEVMPNSFDVPYNEIPTYKIIYEAWQRGDQFLVVHLSGEQLTQHQQYLAKFTDIPIQQFKGSPDHAHDTYTHAIFYLQGYLLIISSEPLIEYHDIFKRVGVVFQQTYTRFLDLQKAEAQARESKVQLALERVRAKTMAMQKSEEVQDTTLILFQQFKSLGATTAQVSICIFDEQIKTGEMFLTLNGEKIDRSFRMTLDDEIFVMKNARISFLNKQKIFSSVVKGKELQHYNRWRNEFIGKVAWDESDAVLSQSWHVEGVFFSRGMMGISSGSAPDAGALILLERFANVFDLTFTRFLDLQKAEMQAREAQIEAAMERVRGKAMAMHNSSDMATTALMVFTEMRRLGLTSIRCGVGLFNSETTKALLYSAGDSLSLVGWVLLTGHPVLEAVYASWQNMADYFPELSGEQLKLYYDKLLSGLTLPARPEWRNGEKQFGHFIPFSVGTLYAWADAPYNEEQVKIFKRFASVIDLTFRRYLELQKSEANAKEAVKQASLDRIRADIASMRTVTDLDRITPLVWNELTILGIPFIRCGVFIMDDTEQLIHTFLSTPDGKAIGAFDLPYNTPGNISKVLGKWRQKTMYVDHWDEDSFREFAATLVKQGALTSADQYLKSIPHGGFHLHFVPFLQGMLYVGNTNELTNEQVHLIQSLADAFSTAYARYEDFNKLEAAKQQVEYTLVDLKQAQQQLVQSEKMASLGELTAGIAHEIQNPLNFVNNFAEVSNELIDEMKDELSKGHQGEAESIALDLKNNLEKINHHGKRADAIVKGMLQHSRISTGQKEYTDINLLADEYLRLAYHGLRAKDKTFNAKFETCFDQAAGKLTVVPQDIGRVILNLINNAFYSVSEKKKQRPDGYEPTVTIGSKDFKDRVEVTVSDNGNGIPAKALDKIFQPFFTTKPTGQGTGLGLSLAYDILKAHDGDIKVDTNENEGSTFTIVLPR